VELTVPVARVISIATGPALALTGVTAVICVEELTVKDWAGIPPKLTALTPERLLPVITTMVPPFIGPLEGVTELIAGATYRNFCVEVTFPRGVVIDTSTSPVSPDGATAVIWFAEFTTKLVAGINPNRTSVAPVRLVPAITIEVPPEMIPVFGVMLVIDGFANVKDRPRTTLPPAVSISTSTIPADLTGVTAVILVGELTTKLAAAIPPNVTF
jgi:hypothetical protein